MIKNKTVTAILLVAGNSTRFGQNRNKNFESICEKTIMSYSLNAFDKNQYVDDMIVVAKESEKEKVQNIVMGCFRRVCNDFAVIHERTGNPEIFLDKWPLTYYTKIKQIKQEKLNNMHGIEVRDVR